MLAAEKINITTERNITLAASAGTNVLHVDNTKNLITGSTIMVKHADGKYWNYIITSLTPSSIAVFPALRSNVAINDEVERLWFNRAHPGKFYMRYLAQRIANAKEIGEPIFFINKGFVIKDTHSTVTHYYPSSPVGENNNISFPSRFPVDGTMAVDFSTKNPGYVQTNLQRIQGYSNITVELEMATDYPIKLSIVDEKGNLLADKLIAPLFVTTKYLAHQREVINFITKGAKNIRFIFAPVSHHATSMVISYIAAFNAPKNQRYILSKRDAVIVGLGDSWMAGDAIDSPERESILIQLAIELPRATIINAGVSGNKIDEELARFDVDVTPYHPDYVLINTGTNEVYYNKTTWLHHNSAELFTNSYFELIKKIKSIGARPIILGPPALSERDDEMPSLPDWTLWYRSNQQYMALIKSLNCKD